MDEAVPRMQESSQPPTPPPRSNPKRAPKEVQSRREKENVNRAAGPSLFQGRLVSVIQVRASPTATTPSTNPRFPRITATVR